MSDKVTKYQGIIANKAGDIEVIDTIRDMVEAGELDPLKSLAYMRAIQTAAEEAGKRIIGIAEEALMKYDPAELKSGVNIGGYNMQVKRTAGKWSHTDGEILDVKRRLKKLQELGKDAANGKIAIDPETGAYIVASTYMPGQLTVYLTKIKD